VGRAGSRSLRGERPGDATAPRIAAGVAPCADAIAAAARVCSTWARAPGIEPGHPGADAPRRARRSDHCRPAIGWHRRAAWGARRDRGRFAGGTGWA